MEIPGAASASSSNEVTDVIEGKIKAQGDKVRELKSAKADKTAVDDAVKTLLTLKSEYKAAAGKDWKPPAEPKAAPKKAASPPAVAATAELTGPAAAIDAAIKEIADKAAVDKAVQKLLALKVKFKAETVADWKPAEQKKNGKGKENKKPASAAPADGEKSETQKKRHAK